MTITEIEEFELSLYKDGFLTCRTIGHSWKANTHASGPGAGSAEMVLTCRNCGAKRIDEVGRWTGEVLSRRYVYPDHYRHHGRLNRITYRLEFVSRVVPLPLDSEE